MPVFVPLLLIAGSVLTGGLGLKEKSQAKEREKRAQEQYAHQREIYDRMVNRFTEERECVVGKFCTLNECRTSALNTRRKAAEFLKRAHLRDLDIDQTINLTLEELERWEADPIPIPIFVSDTLGIAGTSISTASAVYHLVGQVAKASTGTAIKTLSGAAAQKATLAWLGGGTLAAGGGGVALGSITLNGAMVGPALLAAGIQARNKAYRLETQIADEVAKLEVAEAEMELLLAEVQTGIKRVDELVRATKELDGILNAQIEHGDPNQDQDAYQVYHTAVALTALLEVKITDENGNFVQE
jgi:hypothetical protein